MIPANRRTQATSLTRRERVRRGSLASEHVLQLFDTDESLANAVSTFLAEGYAKGDKLIVVATAAHWSAIRAEMLGKGVDVEQAISHGQLELADAAELLSRFMRRGQPNRALFRQTVAVLVAELAVAPLRIYGEMVELLACEGNYNGAAQLEELWNELSLEHSFTLLCGYSAAHFAGPDAGSALAIICCQHSRSFCERHDQLAQFLLSKQTDPSGAAPAAH